MLPTLAGMTPPGPKQLGRGIVVRRGAPIPEPWSAAPTVTIDDAALAEMAAREALTDRLHRSWVSRSPVVIEWDVADDALALRESYTGDLWSLDAAFLFPFERLRFLCFSNNYDARNGEPKWWWAAKSRPVGAVASGPADVRLAGGGAAWIDGGPRTPLPPLDHPVIHGETVELGGVDPVPTPVSPGQDGLAADQLAAVAHRGGAARIIAPAGSGKTRTLTARLRHVLDAHRIDARHVLAVAYNERAAAELRDRLEVDRSLARTIHSLGWQILREAHPGLELLDERGVRDLFERLVDVPRRTNTDPIGPYLEASAAVRSRLRDPADVEASRDDVPGFADAFAPLRERMYAMGRVDHGEQVFGAIEALLADPELRSRWQARCRHLLVDEFQDLTPAFVLLLRLVAAPQLSVFGVGDDDQVIYGYDGADPGFLIDFDRYFPGAHAHALETNYRCRPEVVTAAGHLLGYNRRRLDKTIRAAREPGDDALIVDRLDGSALAAACADRIAGWLDAGVPAGSIAVLARVNAALIPVKAALAERGIATHDLLGPGSLDRTAVRALFAWMQLALVPERMSRTNLLTAVRRPSRGLNRLARELLRRRSFDLDDLRGLVTELGPKQADRWDGFCDDLTRAVAAAGGDAARLVDTIVGRIGLGSSAQTLDSGRRNAGRSAHLDDLVAVARAAPLHDGADTFVAWLRSAVATPSEPGGVVLSSVHRVKGMEWPHVVVFGADEGTMPHDLAEDLEEERRVFHVALTRAIEQVVVMADTARPSRFLAELDGSAPRDERRRRRPSPRQAELIRLPGVGDRVRLWGGIEGRVARLAGHEIAVALDSGSETIVGPADVVRVTARAEIEGEAPPALVEALKQWRRETAQRLGVPAYVVLHDKSIDEIARRRPESERALLAIGGIGPAKLEAYGDDLLALVAAEEAPAE